MIEAAYIALLAAMPWLGRWIEKRSQRVGPWEEITVQSWIVWGRLTLPNGAHPFIWIRLPSWSWEYNVAMDEYGMAQRSLLWIRGKGWTQRYLHESSNG
jgi:hypothetical protein